jgi:PIN domain nuclease of toxin-antitoxin system
MSFVLDASALIAYLRGEPGAEIVESLLLADLNSMAHAVNLCEVYYDFFRAKDEEAARSAIRDLESIGLLSRGDMDAVFWQNAGKHKAEIHRVSLADCFCIALTQRVRAELITADHHEFDRVAQSGICPIRFIR